MKEKLERGEIHKSQTVIQKKIRSLEDVDDPKYSRVIFCSHEKIIKRFVRS